MIYFSSAAWEDRFLFVCGVLTGIGYSVIKLGSRSPEWAASCDILDFVGPT